MKICKGVYYKRTFRIDNRNGAGDKSGNSSHYVLKVGWRSGLMISVGETVRAFLAAPLVIRTQKRLKFKDTWRKVSAGMQ